MESVFEAFGELYLADSSVEYNRLMHLHEHGKSWIYPLNAPANTNMRSLSRTPCLSQINKIIMRNADFHLIICGCICFFSTFAPQMGTNCCPWGKNLFVWQQSMYHVFP